MTNLTAQDPTKLVRISAAFLMYEDRNLSARQALENLEKQLAEAKTDPSGDKAKNSYFKSLINSNLEAKVITDIITTLKDAYRDSKIIGYVDIWLNIRSLKFSREETFTILEEQDYDYLSDISDTMKLWLGHLSGIMTRKVLTLEEALKDALNPLQSLRHFALIRHKEVKLLLSKEAIVQLYLHARMGMVIGQDYYNHENADNAALRDNAVFHAEHRDRVYLETDRNLKDLGFTVSECNLFLTNYTNQTDIVALHEKVLLMKNITGQINSSMQGPEGLNFSYAKATAKRKLGKSFNDADFELLYAAKTGLNPQVAIPTPVLPVIPVPAPVVAVVPPAPVEVTAPAPFEVAAPIEVVSPIRSPANLRISHNNYVAGVNDNTLLMGGAAAIFVLVIACCCRIPIVTSLISKTGRILGCFSRRTENDLESPAATNDTSSVVSSSPLAIHHRTKHGKY